MVGPLGEIGKGKMRANIAPVTRHGSHQTGEGPGCKHPEDILLALAG